MGRPSKTTQTRTWLKAYLAQGSKPAEEVALAAKQLGISPRTLNTIKRSLGVESVRRGGGFHWRDPDVVDSAGGSPDLILAIQELTKAVRLLARHPSASPDSPDVTLLPLPAEPVEPPTPAERAQFAAVQASLAREYAINSIVEAEDPFAVFKDATAREINSMEMKVKNRKFKLEGMRKPLPPEEAAEVEKWNKWLKEANAKIAQLTSGQPPVVLVK